MFRFALFVAGCIAGYVASGYLDGLLNEEEASQSSASQKDAGATS